VQIFITSNNDKDHYVYFGTILWRQFFISLILPLVWKCCFYFGPCVFHKEMHVLFKTKELDYWPEWQF